VALCVAAPAWSQNVAANPFDTLHQALHLTSAQEAAWKVYRAQATAPTGAQERRKAAAGMFTTLNAPQRMDLVEAEMKQDLPISSTSRKCSRPLRHAGRQSAARFRCRHPAPGPEQAAALTGMEGPSCASIAKSIRLTR
jgi:hypothetical protein